MKKQLLVPIACVFLLVLSACKKGKMFMTDTSNIVKVRITGSTSKELEFLYKDSVIARGSANGSNFESTVLLNVAGADSEIRIREKGATGTLDNWTVTPSPFSQTFTIYYDGAHVYDGLVNYNVKGYAMSGELEFLLDGTVVAEGALKIDKTHSFPINENTPRELQVRKKGTTEILLTRTIHPSPVTGQSLNFFFDGTSMVDNVKLSPPKNPANMAIGLQFKTTFTDPGSNTLYFTGGAEIDMVFYIRKKGTANNIRPNPEPKADPEIRITVPTDGTFISFELPPLANPVENEYSIDICKKGTDEIPYVIGTTSTALFPDVRANGGRYGTGITFTAGASTLLAIKDVFKPQTSPRPFHRIPIGEITDLSQYFK